MQFSTIRFVQINLKTQSGKQLHVDNIHEDAANEERSAIIIIISSRTHTYLLCYHSNVPPEACWVEG